MSNRNDDIDCVRYDRDKYKKYMYNAQEQIVKNENMIEGLKNVAHVAQCKQAEAEQDRDQMRAIMTQQITESNHKINLYVGKIKTLEATLRGLQEGT